MHIKASAKGAFVSFIILLILGLGFSSYYHFGSVSNQLLNYLVSFIIATSFLLGGFASGYSSGEKGLITGITSAIIAVCCVILILTLGVDTAKDWMRLLINTIFALLASGIGGIIGVSRN